MSIIIPAAFIAAPILSLIGFGLFATKVAPKSKSISKKDYDTLKDLGII